MLAYYGGCSKGRNRSCHFGLKCRVLSGTALFPFLQSTMEERGASSNRSVEKDRKRRRDGDRRSRASRERGGRSRGSRTRRRRRRNEDQGEDHPGQSTGGISPPPSLPTSGPPPKPRESLPPGVFPKSALSTRMEGLPKDSWSKPAMESVRRRSPESVTSRGGSNPERFVLGATQGQLAAGAWAARLEVANLLESRCDPGQLIHLIRGGHEGPEKLDVSGTPHSKRSRSPLRRAIRSPAYEPSLGESPSPGSLFDEKGNNDAELGLQKALLESLSREDRDTPDWVRGRAVAEPSRAAAPLVAGPSSEYVFEKRARPPTARSTPAKPGGRNPQSRVNETPEAGDDTEGLEFAKRAEPPKAGQGTASDADSFLGKKAAISKGPSDVRSMKDREEVEMNRFHMMALELYKTLKELGVAMELKSMVEGSSQINEMRFRLHTAPNRAATGIRYARVLKNLFDFAADKDAANPEGECFVDKVPIVEYAEHLVQTGAGYRTPQAVLYSLDFFSKAFGFELKSSTLERIRRLAQRYAQSKPDLVSRAESFSKEFILFLEKAVLDPLFPKAFRTVCGKLRLCIQASIRYDDLLNTPLSAFEWARRRGEAHVVAIRSRALRGKSGARLWVCSVMGLKREHDMWLVRLVELLMETHGTGWKDHDHTGRSISLDGSITSSPSTLESDVKFLKEYLEKLKEEGTDVGMSLGEISTLRWHGAKSTMTSLMQHLQLPERMVRLSGGWKSAAESMPDVYLRELQLMVLQGQEKCLAHLRSGGTMGGLESEPIGSEIPGGVSRGGPAGQWADRASHGEDFVGLDPRCCPEEMLDPLVRNKDPELEELTAEVESQPDCEKRNALLEEIDAGLAREEQDVVVKAELDDEETTGWEKVDGDAEEESKEEDDSEFLVSAFVALALPNQKSKLHMAAKDSAPLSEAIPRCRANGNFSHFPAKEQLDPRMELCKRCFGLHGKTSCRHLCEFRVTDPGGTVLRCGRACAELQGEHPHHSCTLHKLD